MIRRTLAAAAVLGLIGLGATACASTPATGVAPGDGPATAAPADPSSSDPTTTAPADPSSSDPTTEETLPTETTPTPAEPAPADFHQKYTYEDGVQVEVTKIEHGKVTRADAEYSAPEAKAGDSYVVLSSRIKNGSKKTIDTAVMKTVTYGPDGTEAAAPYIPSAVNAGKDTVIDGKILPGKSKTGSDYYVIPAKYQGDVTLEFQPDFDHESAVFAGSVK